MSQFQDNLHASILDKLIDLDPGTSSETQSNQSYSLRDIKSSVARDIEQLLNTKRDISYVPSTFKEVENSVFTFGLNDYSADNPGDTGFRKKILKDIRATLKKFEPRLKNVTVRLGTVPEKKVALNFRISGLLVVDPIAEPVIFDTRFDAERKEYHVEL